MMNVQKFADCHVHPSADAAATVYMLDELAGIGITDMSLLAVQLGGYDNGRVDSNVNALNYKQSYKRINLRVFGGLYYDSRNVPFEEQIKSLLFMGCTGIKLIEMKPTCRRQLGFGLNDMRYDAMFSALERQGTPILAHVDDPETFWDKSKMTPGEIARGWWYGDGSYPSKQQIYDETFEMLNRHPNLNVTFAHFFFLSNDIDEADRVFRTYPNVKFDLTPGWEMYLGFSKKICEYRDFFARYSDRILYGTDSNSGKKENWKIHELVRQGLSHDETEFKMPIYDVAMRGLGLDDEILNKICYSNYFKFIGEKD